MNITKLKPFSLKEQGAYLTSKCGNADCCETTAVHVPIPVVLEDDNNTISVMVGLCDKCAEALTAGR